MKEKEKEKHSTTFQVSTKDQINTQVLMAYGGDASKNIRLLMIFFLRIKLSNFDETINKIS